MSGFSLRRGGWSRPFAATLSAGSILAGRYRILRIAASGGMGRIYEAEDQSSGAKVALKILGLDGVDGVIAERFEREIRILHNLRHENLVRAFDAGRDGGGLYLTLEWLEGEDLSARLARGPLELGEACAVVRGALGGLAAVHDAGIVHRDLKPGNIFLVQNQKPPEAVKLLDFGVAKLLEAQIAGGDEPSLTMDGVLVGTPYYMSPEQAQGRDNVDRRADLFALGAVLYESISGRRPFEGNSSLALLLRIASESVRPIRELDPSVPIAVDEFLRRALERDPDRRFQSARAMAEALDRVQDSLRHDLPTLSGATPDGSRELPAINYGVALDEENTATGDLPGDAPTSREAPADSGGVEVVRVPTGKTLIPVNPSSSARPAVTVVVADCSALGGHRRLAWAMFQRAVETEGGQALPVRGGVVIGLFDGEAGRAARAALAAVSETHGMPRLRVAVGTGSFFRAPGALDITGEAIEHASSALGFAEAGEVVIDEKTYRKLRDEISVQSRGPAYRLLGEVPRGTIPPQSRSEAKAPMIGRDRELRALLGAFERTMSSGQPGVAVVLGAEGLGKTRLGEVFRERAAKLSPRVSVLFGEASPGDRAVPFAVLADVFRRRGSIRGNESVVTLLAKLERLVPKALGADRDLAVTAVARLVGVALPAPNPHTSSPAALESRAEARALSKALLQILEAYTRDGPVVLILENMQWVDPASLEVMLAALDQPGPLFLLVNSRPEVALAPNAGLARLEAHHDLVRLALAPLTAGQAQVLFEALEIKLESRALLELTKRIGGQPHVLEEAARLLRAGKRVEELPSGFDDLLRVRLAQLPEAARGLLAVASVFGVRFWDEALRGLGQPQPQALLGALISQQFVSPRESSHFAGTREFQFRSAALREVVYQSLSPVERTRLHAQAGAWLLARAESGALFLAEQLRQGGQPGRAAVHLARGARQALVSGDALGAVEIARLGLELEIEDRDRAELLEPLEVALELLGDFQGAQSALAARAQIEGMPRPRWLRREAELALSAGESAHALRLFRQAQSVVLETLAGPHAVPSHLLVEQAEISLGLGDALQDRGETVLACSEYESAYSAGRKNNSGALMTRSLLRLGRIAYSTADLGQAVRLFEQARKMARELVDQPTEGRAALGLGAVYWMAGAYDRCLAELEDAEHALGAMPDEVELLRIRIYRAFLRQELGEPCSGELLRVTELAEAGQNASTHLLAGLGYCRGLLEQGQFGEAAGLAESLLAKALHTLPRFVAPLEACLGQALAELGRKDEGLRHAETALRRLEMQKACEDEDPQRIYVCLGIVHERAGHPDLAERQWRRALQVAGEVESRLPVPLRRGYTARPLNLRLLERPPGLEGGR